MPSRKQRRRRQKELRHDYEFVYVDEDGREVETEHVEPEPKRRRSETKSAAKSVRGGRGGGRVRRPVHPPSWSRSGRRALIFFPLFLLVFSFVSRGSSYEAKFVTALLYTLLFIPLTYVIDRTAYNTYVKRGGTPVQSGRKPTTPSLRNPFGRRR